MASTSKAALPQKKTKSITLSFGSDDSVICLDESPAHPILPKFNLNNSFIDLTNSPDFSDQGNMQGKQKVAKTIHLDMELRSNDPLSSSSRVLRSNRVRSLENDEPGPSKAVPRMSFGEPASTSQSVLSVPSRPSINEPCYQKLQEMMNKPLVENNHDFNCVLCKSYIKKGEGVVLKECVHSFCRVCLIDVINRVAPGKIRVDCPNIPEICESFITMDEIRALLGDDFEAFVSKMGDENSTESLLPYLLNMDDLAVIPNIKAFQCPVCFNDIEVGEGILLKNCLHNGCKDCLSQLIEHAEQFEVQCPFVEFNNAACREFIQEKEMRFLTTEEAFNKHLKKSLKIAECVNELNFHCRGLDCENFVELTEGITSFICQVCRALNCVACKAVHPGKKCQEYLEYLEDLNPELKNSRLQNEIKLSEEAISAEIAAGTAMFCPRCQIPVMKITGCDAITCTACKLGICWVTKKPRKDFKRGNGQVVEGCKCKEPPAMKRCHPKCANCH